MSKLSRLLSYGAITVAVLLVPSLLVMRAVPCTSFPVLLLLPIFAGAGYVAFRGSALRTDLAIWLVVGLLYNGWWVMQSVITATPLSVPMDLGRAGQEAVHHPWRFHPGTTYVLRLRLNDPGGREAVVRADDPRFQIWFGQPPVVDITIVGRGRLYLRLNGELSRASLCSGYRECNTSRDELLLGCGHANFFRPDPYQVHTVTVRTVRATPSAATFAPRLEMAAVSGWDPMFCAVQGVALALLFVVTTVLRLVFTRKVRNVPDSI